MAAPKYPDDTTRFSTTDALLSAIGAMLLIVTEMLGAVFAFAWAVSGLLGLGDVATYVLMGVCALPGLYGSYALARRILRVEATLRTMPTGAA